MTRRPYSTEPTPHGTRYLSQPIDPVTGRRLRVTAESPEELASRTARVREVRRDVRWGMPPEQAAQKLRPAQGKSLMARAVWDAWAGTTAPQNRKSLGSIWRRRLEPWIGARRAWDIDAVLLAQWEAELLAAGLSGASVWAAFDCLKAALRRRIPRELPALPWGDWHPHSPRRGGRAPWEPARPAVRSFEEAAELVRVAQVEHERRASHAFPALVVALLTGLRQAELAGLRWDDLELRPDRPELLRVRRQAPPGWHRDGATEPAISPKGKRERRQALHPQAAEILRNLARELERAGLYHERGPVFPAPARHERTGLWRRSGVVLDPGTVQRWAAAAGLRDPDTWGAHSLRHSFVTLEVVSSGGNLRATQLRAGHADARVTQAYLHALGHDLPRPAVPNLPGASFPALPAEGRAAPPLLPPAEPEEAREQEGGAAAASLARAPSFADMARGDPQEGVPVEVARRARAAYSAGYKRAQRAGKDAEDCQRAGMAARRATLGAWGRLRKRLGSAEVGAKVSPSAKQVKRQAAAKLGAARNPEE